MKYLPMEEVNINNLFVNNIYVSLGYKASDINKILPNIKSKENVEEQIKEALRLLLK